MVLVYGNRDNYRAVVKPKIKMAPYISKNYFLKFFIKFSILNVVFSSQDIAQAEKEGRCKFGHKSG